VEGLQPRNGRSCAGYRQHLRMRHVGLFHHTWGCARHGLTPGYLLFKGLALLCETGDKYPFRICIWREYPCVTPLPLPQIVALR
jgi:hypothetical protein